MILFLEQVKNIILKGCEYEECKYIAKEKKFPKYIVDDIEISSDFDRENSNEENYQKNSDKENSNEQNFDEENLKNTNITIKI